MNDQLILNRYRLVERVAVGGSAEVWRAHDEQLDRPVAVKRLHPHLLPDAASRRRLVAEARAAARLSHPAIVGIYDVDITGESAAIVMELVDGESLAARIDRDGPLPERDAVRLTAEIAEALYHAHTQGVVHRDVKPGNVLLATDGRIRLVDFGIAHGLAASTERLTLTGTVVGTLRAMAPEQVTGGPITPRTDLYGIGAVMHEALTGRPPYDASTPVALAEAQRAGPPPVTGVDAALAAVIVSCLSYDPAARPLHAGALATALRAWLDGDPSAAAAIALVPGSNEVDTAAVTQVIPVVGAAAPVPPSAALPAAATNPAATPRRRSAAWPLAAIVALAGLVMVAAIVLGNARPGGLTDLAPTPSSTPSPTAVEPSPTPGWLAERIEEVREHCDEQIASMAEAEMAAMTEEQAKDYADELVRACRDGDGGGGGRGRGGGGGDDD
jgi:eukaryotic-like serine/threonine-protein kinase